MIRLLRYFDQLGNSLYPIKHVNSRSPDRLDQLNIPKRKKYLRHQNKINRELLAIQEYSMHNAPLEEDSVLNQIIH